MDVEEEDPSEVNREDSEDIDYESVKKKKSKIVVGS